MFGFQACPVPPTSITRLVFPERPDIPCMGGGTPVAAGRKLYLRAASEQWQAVQFHDGMLRPAYTTGLVLSGVTTLVGTGTLARAASCTMN